MAKMTKKDLKSILKECLREILHEEGMIMTEKKNPRSTSSSSSSLTEKFSAKYGNQNHQHKKDYSSEEDLKKASRVSSVLNEAVNGLVGEISMKSKQDADIFKEIFEDTAANTLQEQLTAEGNSPGMALPPTEQDIETETNKLKSLTEDGDVGRWAKVAFANSSKK